MRRSRKHRSDLVHGKRPNLDAVRNEINVTPLVDVCLVLLIIFMAVLPEMSRGVEVALPKTQHHTEQKDNPKQAIVTVRKGAGDRVEYYFDRDYMQDGDALKVRVKEALDRNMVNIYLKADSELEYGDVYPVMVLLNEAGSPGLELGTDDLEGGK